MHSLGIARERDYRAGRISIEGPSASLDGSKEILTSDDADILGQVMITSKISSKAQTKIPQPVRAALHVGEGDEIAYRIEGDHVILTKAKREPVDDPFAAFHEWSSEADRRAYGDL